MEQHTDIAQKVSNRFLGFTDDGGSPPRNSPYRLGEDVFIDREMGSWMFDLDLEIQRLQGQQYDLMFALL